MQDNFYQETLQQLEQDLYGQLATIQAQGRTYRFRAWTGQQLPDPLLAIDTETTPIQDREIPQLALIQICGDQGSAFFVHPDRLAQFITQHAQAFYCCHNAVFDFWVIAQHLGQHGAALGLWWDIAGDSRLACTMLLDQLIRLAQIDAEPKNRNLADVAREYCGMKLDKSDPYRLRYGELIGIPESAWVNQEPGFWSYAAADPVATLLTCQAQARIAQELIGPHRPGLLPDAERRYGPLTACLQVQGAIALDYASRIGISVDVNMAADLQDNIAQLVEQSAEQLEELAGAPMFKRYKRTGELRRTRNGVPQRDSKACKAQLEQAARTAPDPIRIPRVKNGTVSDAASFWHDHADADPFIAAYVQFIEQSKLQQFFSGLQTAQVYPRYRPLVRTGRTSCSDPNLQQLPRDGRFRAMIQAPPGYWLLQIDYSVLELRTLAAICLRR